MRVIWMKQFSHFVIRIPTIHLSLEVLCKVLVVHDHSQVSSPLIVEAEILREGLGAEELHTLRLEIPVRNSLKLSTALM